MVSKTISLANAALLLVGASRISSFDENTTEAVTINEFYDRSYKALLSSYPWKFAAKTRKLARTLNTPEYEYLYEFQLPTDYVWVQRTFPNIDYKLLGDKLQCNYKDLGLKYTWLVKEELMPIAFEQAFMYYLASQICITLTEDTTKQSTLFDQFQAHARTARGLDAQMQPTDGWEDFPIDAVRY